MFSFLSVPLIIQIILVIHAFRNNKDRFWIYLLIFIPVIGSAAYFLVEILPDLLGNRRVRSTVNSVTKVIGATGSIKKLQANLEILDTVQNRIALADAYTDNRQYSEAIELYKSCLEGNNHTDPEILRRLGPVCFQAELYQDTIMYIQQLQDIDDTELPVELFLLKARSLEVQGNIKESELCYLKIIDTYNHLEAMYRYGMLLKNQNKMEEAKQQFNLILAYSKNMPNFHKQDMSSWISSAKKELI